jgi:hypothetical protein
MIDEGFNALHSQVSEENRLLDQRLKLLKKIGNGLMEHQCDFKAELEHNNEMDPIPGYEDDFDSYAVRGRPSTAIPGPRKGRR